MTNLQTLRRYRDLRAGPSTRNPGQIVSGYFEPMGMSGPVLARHGFNPAWVCHCTGLIRFESTQIKTIARPHCKSK